jgi:hypothetical protein
MTSVARLGIMAVSPSVRLRPMTADQINQEAAAGPLRSH